MVHAGELGRENIEKAKKEAEGAARNWLNEVLQAAGSWAELELEDKARLVVFSAAGAELEDGDLGETLTQVAVIALEGTSAHGVVINPGDNQTWMDAIWLWQQLRESTSALTQQPTPPGLLLDLNDGMLGAWELKYCPDVENYQLPDLLVPLKEWGGDEYDALIEEAGFDPDVVADNMVMLLNQLNLDVPADAAHEPGTCPGLD
jgi:hypothetical protein